MAILITSDLHLNHDKDFIYGSRGYSTVEEMNEDITTKLEKANKRLYDEVKTVLDKNKQERHIRGGEATKQKYQALKNKKQTVFPK